MLVAEHSKSDLVVRRDELGERLRNIHVVSGLEIAHGGPSYSVPSLKDALVRAGLDAAVFADLTPGDLANGGSDRIHSFARDYGRVPLLRKFHFSKGLARHLEHEAGEVDLVHSHGLWRMPNIYAARTARDRCMPHVISPRGMLSKAALGVSPRSKHVFWHLAQKSAIEAAACIHATSLSEYTDIRELGIKAPIAVVPNGVELPDRTICLSDIDRLKQRSQRTLLYLGRIHPIKGLDDLLVAWGRIEAVFGSWSLRIVGPGEREHVRSLRDAVAKLGLRRVAIEGPAFGTDKWLLLRCADLSILPSYSENFGIAVAESLACGRPVITTKGTPWEEVESRRCGWWIDPGPGSIEAALREALATPAEILDEMGTRGAIWVTNAFSWDRIGEEMARVYRWLCLGSSKPGCVVLD